MLDLPYRAQLLRPPHIPPYARHCRRAPSVLVVPSTVWTALSCSGLEHLPSCTHSIRPPARGKHHPHYQVIGLFTANGQYSITAPKTRVRQLHAIDNKAVLLPAALTEHLPSRLHLCLKQERSRSQTPTLRSLIAVTPCAHCVISL